MDSATEDEIDIIGRNFVSECQQLIVLGNACQSMEAMARAVNHLEAANASIRETLPVFTEIAHNRILGTPAHQQLTKPLTGNVSAVKQLMVHNNDNRHSTQHDFAILSVGDQVPYFVASEVVLT